MLQRVKGLWNRKKLVDKIDELKITNSGLDNDGDPYVELVDGTTLVGDHIKANSDKYLYRTLNSKTRTRLQYECMQVAIDIVIRYAEQGLMYGGPRKQSLYQVKEGDVVAEMGAYQGFCSVKMAQLVGRRGAIVAIEPMPDNFRLLKKNKEINELDQLILINNGVWDRTEDLVFNRKIGDGQSSSIEMNYQKGEEIVVKADTLDNLFTAVGKTHCDLMIIQLNGAEINALRGLSSFKPSNLSIAARYDTEGTDAALAIKDTLVDRGYDVKIVEDDFVFARLV